jgi:hypothetical protein
LCGKQLFYLKLLTNSVHQKGENIMNGNDQFFEKFVDDTGEEYYCPIDAVADDRVVSERELDDCVEVSTANRYSGNIKVVDRSIS